MNAGFFQSTTGTIIGGDGLIIPSLRLGLAFGTRKSEFEFDTDDEGNQDSLFTGIYGDATLNRYHWDFSLSYGWQNGNASREIKLPTMVLCRLWP